MSSSNVCLFHNRRYSSNIQCILNLLRANTIKTSCDLNYLAKRFLCMCQLSDDQLGITDERLNQIQETYTEMKNIFLKAYRWSDEIDNILQTKIFNTCDTKISIYKLLKLICDISNEKKLLEMIQTDKDNSTIPQQSQKNLIRREIDLTVPPNQVGHLFGRNGRIHKSIMKDTNTKIHFNNVPYTISSKKQSPDFNLDLFQSSNVVTAVITGSTTEAVDNAIKAVEDLDQKVQVKISHLC